MILCAVPLNLAGATNCSLKEDNFVFGSSWVYLHSTAGKSFFAPPPPPHFFFPFSLFFVIKESLQYVSQVV